MEYRIFGNTIAVRLDPGEEIVESLAAICKAEDIRLAVVTGLGAVNAAQLGIFDTKQKQYSSHTFEGMYEIASLTGNITRKDGEPYLHLHMVIGNPETGECHGGHMNRGVISATGEIFLQLLVGDAGRQFHDGIGLNLIQFHADYD